MTAMRNLAFVLALGAGLAGAAAPALADNQPSQGASSAIRNDSGSAGPHCHINLTAGEAQDAFDDILVLPSHKAHVATGLSDGTFAAVDCPE
jgi:hypothetical protein